MTIKNVLIITYDWPPRNSIAVYRPYAWAKYWAAQNVSVTVLTAKKCIYDEPLDLNIPTIEGVDVCEVEYRADPRSTESVAAATKKLQKLIFGVLKKYSGFSKD